MRIKSSLIDSMTIFRYSLLVTFAILSNPIFSQITASTASYSSVTQYTSSPQDDVFVFCDNIGTGAGELKAVSNDGTSGWTFTWTKWDSGTGSFAISIPSVNTSTESILTNLPNGLYKVEATNGVNSFNDQAWVLNRLVSSQQPSFSLLRVDCAGVFFSSSYVVAQLKYLNIPSINEILLPATYVFELKRGGINGESVQRTSFANYDGTVKSFFDGEAFEGERDYLMTVTDECGNKYVSSMISSETYVVKAEFSVDPMTGEAPLEVEFRNESVNADDFEWFLYQDFDRVADVTTVESNLLVDGIITDEGPIAYTYLHPGNYYVKLIVSSDKGPETCIDEFYLKTEGTPIVVDTSLVQVPNVFTPNGDGRNDIFRVKSQSLKSFSATIFNRWGKVIYEWRDPDGGWNGKLNGKWATPGTYFYVITATGREEQKKKYTKKGSFMLIRK
ncbi:gliding motility-associated C-terminal domain-containing protein [Labilibaculum sp.]|uniref:gliding motility-associated C-terminal domain-containing protein n=1 Tax=Labilibaculum sp. TaxID=2060723 RepID=UPI002AA8AC36|nr:gliding motility-associated C-terminal domain-containing protein [Labilibaculum sp.]